MSNISFSKYEGKKYHVNIFLAHKFMLNLRKQNCEVKCAFGLNFQCQELRISFILINSFNPTITSCFYIAKSLKYVPFKFQSKKLTNCKACIKGFSCSFVNA